MSTSAALYTIALTDEGMLLACVPHGGDIQAEAAHLLAEIGETGSIDLDAVTVEEGLILTDNPQDGDEVVYAGTQMGVLTDADGIAFEYAVRRG